MSSRLGRTGLFSLQSGSFSIAEIEDGIIATVWSEDDLHDVIFIEPGERPLLEFYQYLNGVPCHQVLFTKVPPYWRWQR